jgi:hypothetical protein
MHVCQQCRFHRPTSRRRRRQLHPTILDTTHRVEIVREPREVLAKYRDANLIPFLETIRKPGRYAGSCGVNALSNTAPDGAYERAEVCRELALAIQAGIDKRHDFAPSFTDARQGLAFGLNPYTDWSLSQLRIAPTHYYVFLGLDWYAISDLGSADQWFRSIDNPFWNCRDQYWHNLWAWIRRDYVMNHTGKYVWRTPMRKQEPTDFANDERSAARFIRADGGAFIFHNLIPYLRPAGCSSAGSKWPEAELQKKAVIEDITEDLRVLRELAGGKIMAFCTGARGVGILSSAGYDCRNIMCWSVHPSRFQPSKFMQEDRWFLGRDHFKT